MLSIDDQERSHTVHTYCGTSGNFRKGVWHWDSFRKPFGRHFECELRLLTQLLQLRREHCAGGGG